MHYHCRRLRAIGLGVQNAPMTKVGEFLCHWRHVEWTYAESALDKRSMAAAFAHMVYLGFHEEHELPPIFNQVLHDTPAELYRLCRTVENPGWTSDKRPKSPSKLWINTGDKDFHNLIG